MKSYQRILVLLTLLASQASHAEIVQKMWLYRTIQNPHWCGVVKEGDAELAAKSGAFDGSEAARLQFRGGRLELGLLLETSEDSYTEDSYRFDPRLRLLSVERYGHYINDPWLRVTFLPGKNGKLTITDASRKARMRLEKAGADPFFWIGRYMLVSPHFPSSW